MSKQSRYILNISFKSFSKINSKSRTQRFQCSHTVYSRGNIGESERGAARGGRRATTQLNSTERIRHQRGSEELIEHFRIPHNCHRKTSAEFVFRETDALRDSLRPGSSIKLREIKSALKVEKNPFYTFFFYSSFRRLEMVQ